MVCKLKRRGREQGIAFDGRVYPLKGAKLINLSREDSTLSLSETASPSRAICQMTLLMKSEGLSPATFSNFFVIPVHPICQR